jgi:hypothetical protein
MAKQVKIFLSKVYKPTQENELKLKQYLKERYPITLKGNR